MDALKEQLKEKGEENAKLTKDNKKLLAEL